MADESIEAYHHFNKIHSSSQFSVIKSGLSKQYHLKDMYNRLDLPEQKNIIILHPFTYTKKVTNIRLKKQQTTDLCLCACV